MVTFQTSRLPLLKSASGWTRVERSGPGTTNRIKPNQGKSSLTQIFQFLHLDFLTAL